tara:strand:- start:150 stop:341 length:192 start_codon:yes stop_codon:yes gene_type:complete
MNTEQKIYALSTLLNDNKIFDKYEQLTGMKFNNDDYGFHELEIMIIEKLEEMNENKKSYSDED